jgi:formylglycine-generating enzyme required for sulfatase activity
MLEGLTPVYTITDRTPETGYQITAASVTADWSKNGYRLPTEAQWEYACRAGTATAFNWGTNYIDDSKANYNASYVDGNNMVAGTFLERATTVGSYAPNAWGLYDMHGNVFEWCWDWNGTYESGTQTDPTGALSGDYRVVRGGSFNNYGLNLRSAYRHNNAPMYGFYLIGFRPVRP